MTQDGQVLFPPQLFRGLQCAQRAVYSPRHQNMFRISIFHQQPVHRFVTFLFESGAVDAHQLLALKSVDPRPDPFNSFE